MANTHQVVIEGFLSWNFSRWEIFGMDPEVMSIVCICNMPGDGFKLEWTGRRLLVPNDHGGEQTFHSFKISGEEAIWSSNLQKWVDAISKCGLVTSAAVKDRENRGQWFRLIIPEIVEPWQKILKSKSTT